MSDQRSFGIVYPLWSHADGGGDLLERAIGEVGIDHITVPVVTGPLVAYRAYATESPKVFQTEGGWHFPPNMKAYAGVRPKSAGWFGKRDLLARVCEVAKKRGVKVYLRLDMRNIPALLDRNPHLRGRNCFGDEMTYAGACLCNPQMRELVWNTLEDLGRYGEAGFELMEMEPDPVSTVREFNGSEAIRSLSRADLQRCFCPSCSQIGTSAGSDVERTAQVARDAVAAGQQSDPDGADQDGGDDETLKRYREVREAELHTWLGRFASHFEHQVKYVVVGDHGLWTAVPGFRAVVREHFHFTGLAGRMRDTFLKHFHRDTEAHGFALPAWRPSVSTADELVRFVHEMQQRGVSFFDFEYLDESPSEALDWLRQAVRYAQRD